MANRLLLTFLALLASLAAQFTPAQARGSVAVDTEIGALASSSVQQSAALALPARRAESARDWRADTPPSPRPRTRLPLVPTVLQGIDRARE